MKYYFSLLLILFFEISFAQRKDLSGLKICIDPGHGGHNAANDRHVIPDPGIDFWESESNFQKALWLKPLLETYGATVILTRNTNDYPNDDEPSLTARWTLANSNNVNWFHSIHSNATGGNNTGTNYTLILVKEDKITRKPVSPEAVTMSSAIYKNIRSHNRTTSSGGNIQPGVYLDYTFYGGTSGGFNLGVLNGLNMPGELSEGSFHDYYPETRRLMNNDYRKVEAYGIRDGFLEYYQVPADSFGIIAGIQLNNDVDLPANSTQVRLMPENKMYTGDKFNNGYFMFDSLTAGQHTIYFESAGYAKDSVALAVSRGGLHFIDRTLVSTAPPFVKNISPANGGTNVVNTTPIEISFSKAMDSASVSAAFSISPNIAGTISWKVANQTISFKPARYFSHSTLYTVKVGASAKSVTGLFIDGNKDGIAGDAFQSLFRIQPPIPPVVAVSIPKQNDTLVSPTSTIGVRFSKAMDTTKLRAAFSIVPAVEGNSIISTDQLTILFKYINPLPYSTKFTLTIAGSALSFDSVALDGNKDNVAGDPFILSFRTADAPAGIVQQSNRQPDQFLLEQNYPNPFNPSTVINYQLSVNSNVTLKLYDVLGREVATLVNEHLPAGIYNYSFSTDRFQLPSGIYFYRLTSGNFSAIKKLVVAK